MANVKQFRITAEDVLREGSRWSECEIWDGIPMVREPSGGMSDAVAARVAVPMANFVQAHELGWVFLSSQGFLLARDPDRMLASDSAYVSYERLPKLPRRGFVPMAPDFCIEVKSPTERWEETNEKCGIWVAHGAACVWAVNPETQAVAVFHPGKPTVVYEGRGTVTADPALPGFELDVEDVFAGLD